MLKPRKIVFVSSESLINLNRINAARGLFDKTQGNTFFGLGISLVSAYNTNKPGQLYHPPMPPPPPPLPAPPLRPNPDFFPGMDIDEDMEDDILWDNEELNDDANPVIEC